jgi:hypothetical protein
MGHAKPAGDDVEHQFGHASERAASDLKRPRKRESRFGRRAAVRLRPPRGSDSPDASGGGVVAVGVVQLVPLVVVDQRFLRDPPSRREPMIVGGVHGAQRSVHCQEVTRPDRNARDASQQEE